MLTRAREHTAAEPRFDYRHLDACHHAMVTDPAEVADILLTVAAAD
jgi:hypothetical protein